MTFLRLPAFYTWLSAANLFGWNDETSFGVAIIDFDGDDVFAAYRSRRGDNPRCSEISLKDMELLPFGSICVHVYAENFKWRSYVMEKPDESIESWIEACFHSGTDVELKLDYNGTSLKIRPKGNRSSFLDCAEATKLALPSGTYLDFELPQDTKKIYFIHRRKGFPAGLRLKEENGLNSKAFEERAGEGEFFC